MVRGDLRIPPNKQTKNCLRVRLLTEFLIEVRGAAKAAVASATTQFHWQDPSLCTENSRGEKLHACFSVLRAAGPSPDSPSGDKSINHNMGKPDSNSDFFPVPYLDKNPVGIIYLIHSKCKPDSNSI